MKRNFTFLGRVAIAMLLVCGMTVSGCNKEPLPDDGNEVVKPGDGDGDGEGDGKEDENDKPSEQGTVTVKASGVTLTSVVFKGNVSAEIISAGDLDYGVSYSTSNRPDETTDAEILRTVVRHSVVDEVAGDGSYQFEVTGLEANRKYYYCSYVKKGEQYTFGEVGSFETADAYAAQIEVDLTKATDLSANGTANCYIVTEAAFTANSEHLFKFPAVKGNDKAQTLSGVEKAEILWESTGTSSIPDRCSIVAGVGVRDNYVAFRLPDTYKKGNAVIAAKAGDGTILWSWHIWVTDQPAEQVYPNNAGTMMDRNLGATSVQGDNDCGLLYQWGRKDPFLGYATGSSSILASSTIKWPAAVKSDATKGTIEWTVNNPLTFITGNYESTIRDSYEFMGETYYNWDCTGNNDWYYNKAMETPVDVRSGKGEKIIGTNRWGSTKTIYDPCPAGWRVPDGGSNSIWNQAGITKDNLRAENGGARMTVGSFSTWYPASGSIGYTDGVPANGGTIGYFWTATSKGADGESTVVYKLHFDFGWLTGDTAGSDGAFSATGNYYPAKGFAVRCCKIQ